MLTPWNRQFLNSIFSGQFLTHNSFQDNMPLSFPCGAAHTSNQPISNRIYNQLRKSAHKDQKRKQRQKEEKERSTAEKAVDENTRILLQKLINIGLGNVLVQLIFR